MYEIIDPRNLKQEGEYMKKRIIFACLCLIISTQSVLAENEIPVESEITTTAVIQNDYSSQLVQKIAIQRSTIYNALNLTPEQIKQVKHIDECRYKELEPELRNLCILRKKLDLLNKQESCNKQQIKTTEKELDCTKKQIKSISNKYDKEFKKLLTSDQKSKYSMVRKLKRSDLKKVEKIHKNGQKTPDLKPFGDKIPQAVYTEEVTKQNSFWNKLKKCKTK